MGRWSRQDWAHAQCSTFRLVILMQFYSTETQFPLFRIDNKYLILSPLFFVSFFLFFHVDAVLFAVI